MMLHPLCTAVGAVACCYVAAATVRCWLVKYGRDGAALTVT